MAYHTVAEVLSDRRKGVALNEVIDSLLQTPRVWEEHLTPFSIIHQLYEGDYVDMTAPAWRSLFAEQQLELARAYQWWYAHRLGLSDIYKTFEKGTVIKMVLVPPMRYWIGHSDKAVLVENAFWMGEHEVTQGQWLDVMGGRNPAHFQGDLDLPVERVSWNECQKFCKKTETELPTEEQWELACRSGTTTDYSFGSDLKLFRNYGWYWDNAREQTHPVKQKSANAFGLYDMHGNVWEWCGTKANDFNLDRIYRGGGFLSGAWFCSSGNRTGRETSHRYYDIGFRVMREI